jgi:PleD family two-component response regulator
VTVSIGAAALPIGGLDPSDVLAQADQALYRAKAAGRNMVAQARHKADTKAPAAGARTATAC